jgi:phosphoserine aminotransferase
LFDLPEGYEIILGNGGATAFWDIAAFGLVRAKASTWPSVSSPQSSPSVTDRRRSWASRRSSRPSPARWPDAVPRQGRRLRLGAQRDLHRGHGAHRGSDGTDADALVLIDATSGAGGLPVDMTQADVYYFAPQKCFASDGGLWIALMSPAALARAEEIAASGRWVPTSSRCRRRSTTRARTRPTTPRRSPRSS